jgi:thioredoxin
MTKKILLSLLVSSLFFLNCNSEKPAGATAQSTGGEAVVKLSTELFKKQVFNYEQNKEWKYEGTKPAIIDFYADWCAPCRQLSPVIEELAKEYGDKIVVYKVDTEKETDLVRNLGISGLPTLLFIPAEGKPSVSMGYVPKETLKKAINDILQIK